jgi:hypothetical protein
MSSGENAYVLKLDADGNFIWAKQLVSISENYAVSLALDPGNNILVTGIFQGTADFDPNAGTTNLSSLSMDMFIWKLDADGNFIWAKQIDALSGSRCRAIACDKTGNIFVTGRLAGTTDFDPSASVSTLTTSALSASFLLRLNTAGDFVWAKQLDNADLALGDRNIAIDSSAGIVLCGTFSGIVDFDPGTTVQDVTSTPGASSFLLKLDNDANFMWVKPHAGIKAVTLDGQNNIYTCGSNIQKFDQSGVTQWMAENSLGFELAVDKSGNVYTTGVFNGTVDFDPGSGMYILTSTTSSVFVQKLAQHAAAGLAPLSAVETALALYPNPNAGTFYLYANASDSYVVTNCLGQVVKTIVAPQPSIIKVETTALPDGIYFVTGSSNPENNVRMRVQH